MKDPNARLKQEVRKLMPLSNDHTKEPESRKKVCKRILAAFPEYNWVDMEDVVKARQSSLIYVLRAARAEVYIREYKGFPYEKKRLQTLCKKYDWDERKINVIGAEVEKLLRGM